VEIEIPKSLALTEDQVKRLTEKLSGEVVDTAKDNQAAAVTAIKEVEQSEVAKVKKKVKVTE
jgi:hypothetical protein